MFVNAVRRGDGTRDASVPCCMIVTEGGWAGDYTNPILEAGGGGSRKKIP